MGGSRAQKLKILLMLRPILSIEFWTLGSDSDLIKLEMLQTDKTSKLIAFANQHFCHSL
jgi:hypothetical protein